MMAVDTFGAKKSIQIVKKHWVISRNGNLNVTIMARTIKVILRTSGTAIDKMKSVNDILH